MARIGATAMMGAGSLGTLFVRLTADSMGLVRGLEQAERRLSSSSAIMVRQAAMIATGVTASLSIIGIAAVREFAKFDKAMTEALAIMGDVSEQMEQQMKDVARSIAREGVKSAEDLAHSYFFLASAGFKAEEAMGALPTMARFATAGNFDLGKATNLLVDAQSALGLRTKDVTQNLENMTRVSDVLTKANIISTAQVEEFSEALTNKAANAARLAGKDVEEVTAVLAAFANQGIKGRAAGEAFSIMMRDLQTRALTAANTFKKFNVAVFDQHGKIRNIADIIEDLEKTMRGATDEEERAILKKMQFQDRSVANIQALLGLSEKIREYEKALRSAGGVTQDVSEKQLTSFTAQLTITSNLIKDLLITIGEGLEPSLTLLNEALQGTLQTLTAMNKPIKAIGDYIGKVLIVAIVGMLEILKKAIEGMVPLAVAVNEIIIKINKGIGAVRETAGKVPIKSGFTDFLEKLEDIDTINIVELAKSLDVGIELVKKAQARIAVGFVEDALKPNEQMITRLWGDPEWLSAVNKTINAVNQLNGAAKKVNETVGEGTKHMRSQADQIEKVLDMMGMPEGFRSSAPSAQELLDALNEQGDAGTVKAKDAERMLREAGMLGSGGAFGTRTQAQELQDEIEAQQNKLKVLEKFYERRFDLETSLQNRIEESIAAHNQRVRDLQRAQNLLVVRAGQEMFDALSEAAEGYAGKQSGLYKTMFAVSKAFAIAESIIKIQQGIAGALASGATWQEKLIAAASVASAAANIMSTIRTTHLEIAGERAQGGSVGMGRPYLVGERGPEIFTPGRSGGITPNDMIGGLNVNIYNNTDNRVEVKQTESGVDIFVDKVEKELASRTRDGRGNFTRALEQTYALKRGRG